MRLLLALSATGLLAVGTALSFQAMRVPAPSELGASRAAGPQAVAAAPPAAASRDADRPSLNVAVAPVTEPSAPTIVKVKTVRIEPELPVTGTEGDQQASTMPEVQQPETTTVDDQSTTPPAAERTAALKARAPGAESTSDLPAPRLRTGRAKLPAVAAKRTSHRKRKQEELAGDDVAKDTLSYAPKEPGPESLNPLGKLLSGTR